jgi:hypothetical protein
VTGELELHEALQAKHGGIALGDVGVGRLADRRHGTPELVDGFDVNHLGVAHNVAVHRPGA